ncbi:Aste57867_2050 [Aphanomyces stellatus]|uniref:HECT-type E3 ubiquitin transferase n=1 Tax=Aphanomyces stellatus TaxID=120398 RepID=A0A485KBS7_9STRA|nr:hypothetical protein As57867_002046 [Aphanomyces stellatus]VFT79254.1 Aste57867_2050 [Aphanomyces stellatus]
MRQSSGNLRSLLDDDKSDHTIYITTVAVIALFCVFNLVQYIKQRFFPSTELPPDAAAALLDNNFLRYLPGWTRGDIERQLKHAERWNCVICGFENLVDTLQCHLCGTQSSVHVVVDLSNGSSDATTSAPLATSDPLSSDTCCVVVDLPHESMTHRQQCARSRKKWTRQRCTAGGNVVWQFHHATKATAFESRAHVMQLVNVGESHDDVTMTWTPVEMCRGDETVLGTSLAPPLWADVLHVTSLPFSDKYEWFLQQTAVILHPYDTHRLRFKCHRQDVATEALGHLANLQGDHRCATARYEFDGEFAIDAGAVQREWFMLVAQALMSDTMGLFVVASRDTHSYYINSDLSNQTKTTEYRAVGRFIGRAILCGQVIPMHFSPVLFKAILGVPVSLQEIACMDPQMHRSFMQILHADNVDEFGLTFSAVESDRFSGMVEVDVIPNGRNIAVTQANVADYITCMTRYVLLDRVQAPLAALLQGVYDIVPPELLLVFDFLELELLVCGLAYIDVHDWKLNTMISSNLQDTCVHTWFWEIVAALSPADQAKLLQFCTGSSRVPVQGFKGLTSYDGNICHFSICGMAYTPGAYPVAHACFNRLDLPLYPEKALVEDAITALLQSDPTGFNIV